MFAKFLFEWLKSELQATLMLKQKRIGNFLKMRDKMQTKHLLKNAQKWLQNAKKGLDPCTLFFFIFFRKFCSNLKGKMK